ncbi:MAG: restriction endonuclease, partial [Lachnospiraceae bacterium]|nr:restriction endonuclease [Lachnospiraceae bacterium]
MLVTDNPILSIKSIQLAEMVNTHMDKSYHLNWDKYNWRDFEQICFEYVKECYSAKFYKRTLTRAQKDQGRDIIIKGRKIKFEAWGECKAHKRNIGLDTIGKNIVLALSHQINKAIFFSVTSITLNTKIEILNVAQLHGFEVLFLDGNELNKSILSCQKVSHKYFRKEYEKYIVKNSNPLWIDTYLSEYPFAEDAKNNSKRQYHLENGFHIFMHLFIKNVGTENVTELHIELDEVPSHDIIFYQKELELNSLITSHTDLLYTFQGLVFSPKKDIEIPCVRISYFMSNGIYIQENIEPGTIDASDIWKAPYVNSNSAQYLNEIYNVLEHVIPEKYVRILFVYGKSGMGKSRLMSEIENKAYECSYRVIHVDFREKNELYAMRDFIFLLLGLPASKHKIVLSSSDFQMTFKDKIDITYVSVLYSYLYEANVKMTYDELTDAIIELLIFSSEREALIVGIDNIQELSYNLQVLFWNTLERCKELSISVCFLFSLNTERFSNDNNVLVNYLNLCGDKRESYILPYECDLLELSDAVTLMQHLLHLFPGNRQLIIDILGTEGISPMDILLLSKTLSQTDGLFVKFGEYQYIKNTTLFSEKISIVSASTDAIIENRLANLKKINMGSIE